MNAEMKCTEIGIDPSPGGEVHATEEDLAQGKDAILDFAIEMLKDLPLPEGEPDEGDASGSEEGA